jgi:hypothetical protein
MLIYTNPTHLELVGYSDLDFVRCVENKIHIMIFVPSS